MGTTQQVILITTVTAGQHWHNSVLSGQIIPPVKPVPQRSGLPKWMLLPATARR